MMNDPVDPTQQKQNKRGTGKPQDKNNSQKIKIVQQILNQHALNLNIELSTINKSVMNAESNLKITKQKTLIYTSP